MHIMTTRTRFLIVGLVALFVGLVNITPARADDDDDQADTNHERGYYVERDSKGQRTGTIEEELPGYLIQRDTSGWRTGTIEREGDQWIKRDLTGKRVGTIERQ